MRIYSFTKRKRLAGTNSVELASCDASNSKIWAYGGLNLSSRYVGVKLEGPDGKVYVVDINEYDIKGMLEAISYYKRHYPDTFPDIPTLDKKPTD